MFIIPELQVSIIMHITPYFNNSIGLIPLQSTLYDVAKAVLSDNLEISSVELDMPNLHYIPADLTKLGIPSSNDVCCCCKHVDILSLQGLSTRCPPNSYL